MTIPTTVSAWGPFLGNDVTQSFPYEGVIFAATDLIVTRKNVATGAVVTLSYPSQYTVTGVRNLNGGFIALVAGPLATGYSLRIRRVVTLRQDTSIKNQGAFHAEIHEDEFDLRTMVDQQLQEQLDRSLKFGPESGISNVEIDDPESNKLLGWNLQAPWHVENKDVIDPGSVIASNNTPQPVSSSGYSGTSNELSRSDHKHKGVEGKFSIVDYGADPTGATASDTAYADARTDAINSGLIFPQIYIPDGSYLFAGSLNANGVRVIGESMTGTILYQPTSSTAINGILRADGTASDATTIVGTVTKGDRTITLTSAANYVIGDLIEILNTEAAVQAADGTNNSFALLTLVQDKSGNTLTLLDPVPFAIGASDTETVSRITPTTLEIHNLTLNGLNNTGHTPYGNNPIVIFYSRGVVIRNVNTINFQKGNGIFLWSSYDSRVQNYNSQNVGDTIGFGSALATFNCTHCDFDDIRTLWPSRDGMTFSRNSLCHYTGLTSIRAPVRNVKFHGCRQCVAVNIIGNNGLGGTGLTISGGTSDCVLTNITTVGNKGPNASGNQNGVWFADLTDQNNILNGVNSWDNGDWDLAIFTTDTGNVINGARFSSALKVLNQNHTPMFNVMLDDVLTGGLTSVGMVDTQSMGTVGPSHRLFRSASGTGLLGEYVFAGINSNNALVEYAKMFGGANNATVGSESGAIAFSSFQSGTNNNELQIGGGILIGNATGAFKGVGTINAEAVYDDNTVLTCYVLEHALQRFSGQINHNRAMSFNPEFLDIKKFLEFWTQNGHLPSLPSREEWFRDGPKSTGDLVQRLWETVELLAVHIKQLLEKVEEK